jgi:hypothetical protein
MLIILNYLYLKKYISLESRKKCNLYWYDNNSFGSQYEPDELKKILSLIWGNMKSENICL